MSNLEVLRKPVNTTNIDIAAHAEREEPLCYPCIYLMKFLRFPSYKMSITLLLIFICARMDSLHPHYKYNDFFSQQPLENKKRRTVKPSFALFFNFQFSIVNCQPQIQRRCGVRTSRPCVAPERGSGVYWARRGSLGTQWPRPSSPRSVCRPYP